MGRVQDKVILISGGAMGMGRAHDDLLAREGTKVTLADVNAKAGEEAAATIRTAGGKAEFASLNVASEAQWQQVVDGVMARRGHINGLVNNAGTLVSKSLVDTSRAEWDHVFDVNVRGVLFGTRAAVPAMQMAGGGYYQHLINLRHPGRAVPGLDESPYVVGAERVVDGGYTTM